MMYVALSIADWPTGAAANDLLASVLAIAPHAAIAPDQHLVWLDAGGGVDPVVLTTTARTTLASLPVTALSAGAASIPIAAMVAARQSAGGGGGRGPLLMIPAGAERDFLKPLPLAVLDVSDTLHELLRAVGITTCGQLARLDRASVAVRFGREGAMVWRLARADDRRRIFSPRPRDLPSASLDWSAFSTDDLEQLVFVVHTLLRTVCDRLETGGLGARSLVLTLSLENRQRIVVPVGAARVTAQRTTWLRLMRRALERITLPDRVTGLMVHVAQVGAPAEQQGDLFDPGFTTAYAAERAVAQILDLQSDAVVTLQRTAHPLPEHRERWIAVSSVDFTSPGAPVGAITAQAHPAEAALGLRLFPAPRLVDVRTVRYRGYQRPTQYTDQGTVSVVKESLGPQCLSGQSWNDPFAREYHQGIREDGAMVLLYRDAIREQWYLAGWWD